MAESSPVLPCARAKARDNLVIVRAGDNSLHPGWLAPARNWNILVSGYGKAPPPKEHADITHHFRGGKWDGIWDAIRASEEYVFSHRRIMLADDDLRMRADDISAAFAIGAALDLRLYQPSVTGHVYWPITGSHDEFLIRYGNFVEIMLPVIHRDILRFIWRDFRRMRTGSGMDLYWSALSGFPHTAVLDCVPVEHTRPVTGGAKMPGALANEMEVNALRRGIPFSPFLLSAGADAYSDIVAVHNDMRVEHKARRQKCRKRKTKWWNKWWRRGYSKYLIRPEDKPATAAFPQLVGEWDEYAAGKDFMILRRLDRRAKISRQ